MKPSIALTCLLAAGAAGAGSIVLPRSVSAQPASPIAGAWTLNKSLSEMPPELGFAAPWLESSSSSGSPGASGSSGGGGRGRRGGYGGGGGGGGRGGGGNFYTPRESYDDAQRQKMMTAEARNPPARLIIVDNASTVTFTNELGQSRTVHPDGKQESIDIEGVQFPVTARRDGDKLVVNYHIQQNRDVRFTYSRAAGSPSLAVEVQFLEHGTGDKAVRVYNPGSATETAAPAAAAPTPPATAPAKSPAAPNAAAPGARATPAETFDARPGAELKGLTALGVLVEDLSSQAIACGLNHDALESAVSKRLTDGGFSVHKNSDEDTYVYVNVMTTTLPSGTCVSRYDTFLYTHATANLSYRDQPVLVQVSLMHRGGIGSSVPASHAAAVSRGLENYVDLIVTQIHNANK